MLLKVTLLFVCINLCVNATGTQDELKDIKNRLDEIEKSQESVNSELWLRSRQHEYAFVVMFVLLCITFGITMMICCCGDKSSECKACCHFDAVHDNEKLGVSFGFTFLARF